ncbi:uncharacterized protein [Globicephala melas]|uniref:uncharacterized protein n=1 Tax=Globicephala melas TaxID=9731 RepID=UPI0038736B24
MGWKAWGLSSSGEKPPADVPPAKKLAPSQVPFLKHVGFLEGTPCDSSCHYISTQEYEVCVCARRRGACLKLQPAVVRAARGVGSAEARVGRCVRDSRRSWTGRERAGDVGPRPGAPRRSGSAQGARSGASGARPPFWSRWRRPGGPRRGELELGPESDESATPRTWTPGWSPVSRGAAGGENVPACMPTGTTFSRTVKPSVNYAVPPSSTSADIYLNFVELFSSIGCPEKVTTLPTS